MNRRQVLAAGTSTAALALAGCMEALGLTEDEQIPSPEDDPFPTDVADAERGNAEAMTIAVNEESNYEDGSPDCVFLLRDRMTKQEPLRAHVLEQFDIDSSAVVIGFGQGKLMDELDVHPITVGLLTSYARDGSVMADTDLETMQVAEEMPHAIYATREEEPVCGVPTYVYEEEIQAD